MRATIQRITEIRGVPEQESIEIADVLDRSVAVRIGHFQADDLCIHIERPNSSPAAYHATSIQIMKLSEIEGDEEMKVGVSKQPWGDQLQLGPYDDAVQIEVGVDVTCEIENKFERERNERRSKRVR